MITTKLVCCLGIEPLELALIGPVLRGGPEVMAMVDQLEAAGFDAAIFASSACRAIWAEAKRLHAVNGFDDVGMISFCNQCESLGEEICERSLWMAEAANFGLVAMMPHHAGLLTDKRLVQSAKEAMSVISGDSADILISDIEQNAAALRARALKVDNEFKLGCKELIDELDRSIAGETLPPSHVSPWDRMLFGLGPAQLVVLAGRPGGGKSALAEQIIHEQLLRGHPVVYVQREMSRSRAVGRLAARMCGIPWHLIESRKAVTSDTKRFRDAVNAYQKFPLHLEPASLCNGSNIGGMIRHHVRQTGAQLVVFDYLQLVDCPKGLELRRAVGDVCRALKLAANETGATIIAIAQLSRELDRMRTKPTLSHLKESGDIEANADVVLALWEKEDRQERPRFPIEWSILKNRNGGHGSLTMTFDGPAMSFLGQQINTHENP